ncbi:Cupin domain protein [Planctomycetes bacterium MalM25]|nr:Cupin domain protein [Planctomycetes bacterium MalM25]
MKNLGTPGELIDLYAVDHDAEPKPTLLIKTEAFSVLRLVLPAGKVIPEHKAPKEITVQCVRGKVDFEAMGQTQTMTAGKVLFLDPGEPHALTAIEDAIMLVTMATERKS